MYTSNSLLLRSVQSLAHAEELPVQTNDRQAWDLLSGSGCQLYR